MNVIQEDPFVFESRDFYILRIRTTDMIIIPKRTETKNPQWKDQFAVAAVEDDGTALNFYGDLDVPPRIQRQCWAYFRDYDILKRETLENRYGFKMRTAPTGT
jgi:hypothetical protein